MISIMLAPHIARLVSLADREVDIDDGESVFSVGDAVRFVFVVRSGRVRMVRRQPNGSELTLQRVQPGSLVAEASLFASRYHCDALGVGPTVLLRVRKAKVLELQMQEPAWVRDLAAQLASEVQRTRARAELLSLRTVSERVDAWLSLYPGKVPEHGQWAAWASELGVSPEALYRELARRRDKPSVG